ncbi:hypothetical protein PoB_005126800 [Plakobranchus ocellatus]|uniref:Uncharacterized protein n=1 Tax=Plakobranchus ocellatus TaxID=259542 RepID=A0AAV4C0Z9_9GAST|nr:hypothetical protein PoB_005126800 [Plakobranchus ocellatus]
MAFSSSEPKTGLSESANSDAMCLKNWMNTLKSELPWRKKNAPKKTGYSTVRELNIRNILVHCCRYMYVCKIKCFIKRHDIVDAIWSRAARSFHVSHLFLGMQNDCRDLSLCLGDDLDKVLILICMSHAFNHAYLVCKHSRPHCLHIHSIPFFPVFCIVNDPLFLWPIQGISLPIQFTGFCVRTSSLSLSLTCGCNRMYAPVRSVFANFPCA